MSTLHLFEEQDSHARNPKGAPSMEPVWKARNNQRPNDIRDPRRNVEINVGKACNNRCVFCVDGMPKREDRSYMPYEVMQAEIDRWADAGHKSLGFLGGEPTTYPWIVQSTAYAKEKGFTRIAIATNATKLRLTHFTDKLLDAGLTRVTVSIHSHKADVENKLTRVPKNYDKQVAALRYLVEKKKQGYLPDGLSINPVINGWNYRHMPQMIKFFHEDVGINDIRFNFMRPEGYAEGDASLSAKLSDVVPVLMKCVLLCEYHWKDLTFTFGGFPLCTLPRKLRDSETLLQKYLGEYRDLSTDCSVRQDGEGFGIEQIDSEQQRSRFNWQDRKRYDLKSPVEACQKCSKVDLCEGIWNGYLHIHGDKEFRPL